MKFHRSMLIQVLAVLNAKDANEREGIITDSLTLIISSLRLSGANAYGAV